MNNKRICSLLTAAVSALCLTVPLFPASGCVTAYAAAADETTELIASGLKYTVTDGAATVTGYTPDLAPDLVIPASLGGVPVKRIGMSAFANCKTLHTVRLPDGLEVIEKQAFEGCSDLPTVVIPESVSEIGFSAFGYCTRLRVVTVLNPVCKLWPSARLFFNEEDTETGTVKYKGVLRGAALDGTPATIETYAADHKLVFWPVTEETDGGTCGQGLSWSYDGKSGRLTISGEGAMDDYENIEKVPWYMETVSDMIFEVEIQDGVTHIGDWAFTFCTCLPDVVLPESVTSVGAQAFYLCGAMDRLTVLNPDCVLFDADATVSDGIHDNAAVYSGDICGIKGSQAQVYADKYGYSFREYVLPLGNLDGKGAVSVEDAQLALQAYVNKLSKNPTGLNAAQAAAVDVDLSGDVSAEDGQMILQYYVAMLASNPVTWEQLRT